jgi:hypothetical protein
VAKQQSWSYCYVFRVWEFFRPAYRKAATVNCFIKTELFPCNTLVFQDREIA